MQNYVDAQGWNLLCLSLSFQPQFLTHFRNLFFKSKTKGAFPLTHKHTLKVVMSQHAGFSSQVEWVVRMGRRPQQFPEAYFIPAENAPQLTVHSRGPLRTIGGWLWEVYFLPNTQ